jgi:hypothetical protein
VLDEVRGAQVADERARGDAVAQIQRGGDADERQAGELEPVGDPAREVHHREVEQPVLGGDEPDEADADQQVGHAAREQVGPPGAPGEQGEHRRPGGEDQVRGHAARAREHRDQVGVEERDDADGGQHRDEGRLDAQEQADAHRAPQGGQRRRGEDQAAGGQVERAGELDEAVHADEPARRREGVDEQARGHHREGHAEQDGAPIVLAGGAHGEGDGGGGGQQATDAGDDDVEPRGRHHHVPVGQHEEQDRQYRGAREDGEQGRHAGGSQGGHLSVNRPLWADG